MIAITVITEAGSQSFAGVRFRKESHSFTIKLGITKNHRIISVCEIIFVQILRRFCKIYDFPMQPRKEFLMAETKEIYFTDNNKRDL